MVLKRLVHVLWKFGRLKIRQCLWDHLGNQCFCSYAAKCTHSHYLINEPNFLWEKLTSKNFQQFCGILNFLYTLEYIAHNRFDSGLIYLFSKNFVTWDNFADVILANISLITFNLGCSVNWLFHNWSWNPDIWKSLIKLWINYIRLVIT